MKIYMFRTVPVSTIRSFHCTYSSGIRHKYRVSFQNKFENLVHIVSFIIRNLSRCTVTWTSNFMDNVIQWMSAGLLQYVELHKFVSRFRRKVVAPFSWWIRAFTLTNSVILHIQAGYQDIPLKLWNEPSYKV